MASISLQPVPPFAVDAEIGLSLASRWKLWLRDFDTFLLASGITDKKRQRALLLYQAGPQVREIFAQLSDVGGETDFALAKEKLTQYFEPQKNRRYEVYRFRELKQGEQESLDNFHTRLRKMAKVCEFHDENFEIEEQIIIGGRSSRIRKRALRDPDYSLKDMLIDGRRDETSDYQAKDIESKEGYTENTNRLEMKPKKTCNNCGGEWPHLAQCPAKGKTCRKCGKANHFQVVCRSKNLSKGTKNRPRVQRKTPAVRPFEHDAVSSDDDEYLYSVGNGKSASLSKSPKVKVTVGGHTFPIIVDTGATINVIDSETFKQMENITLKPTKVKAYPFTRSEAVRFKGKFNSVIETKSRYATATFFVLNEAQTGCLLSAETAQELGVITLRLNTLSKKSDVQNPVCTSHDPEISRIVSKFQDVFKGLGKLKGYTVKLNIDENAIPHAQPQRRVPFHVRNKVATAIKELVREGIIEPVPEDSPSQWVSPIVVVPKKDSSVRLCVDMRMPNKAIKRVRYPVPTINDINVILNGARYFSKLDLNQAYHQLPLDEESRFITTFTTHMGLYRYTRLNYGTNAAMEIFQHVLQQSLQGVPGVFNLADDIIIFGSTRQEHDKALECCLARLRDRGLTVNPKKCKFLQPIIEFYGQVFSAQGTCPDPKRIAAIQQMSAPSNAKEVRSFLGMVNYSSKYIKDYATLTASLRELTKKSVPFTWTTEHQTAFEQLKLALTQAPVMGYFDLSKDTYVTVDASPMGISAILTQCESGSDDHRVIAYASRSLSAAESRYSQTEKEALSIVWAVEHFHIFLYGKDFTLVTDHKPLEIIYGNSSSKSSARIERWVLRLQPYTFNVKYKPGSENAADYLSRHVTDASCSMQEKYTEDYVCFITHTSVPKAMTIEEIASATNNDRTLQCVRAALRTGTWDVPALKRFRHVKDELTVGAQNIVLRGHRIVIPDSLQQRAIDIAHEQHQGISRTKSLLREKIWFPGIDEMVQNTISTCISCQAVSQANPPEPVKLSEMPNGPWEKVHMDFYGPLPSGEQLLVVIDRYSRFPEVEIVKSTKASIVIPKLDRIFSVHGIPKIVMSDNGPPFSSAEFARYATTLGFTHHFSTPYWPQANGEVERFNRCLGKAIQIAVSEGKVWKQELHRYLFQYRVTPHSITSVAPCELLFNRKVRGKLPSLSVPKIVNFHKTAKDNEQQKQISQKTYIDQRRKAKYSPISVGDCVLVKQEKRNKLSTRFSTTPYTVISRTGTKITARNSQNYTLTRNVSHFKKIEVHTKDDSEIDNEIDGKYKPTIDYRPVRVRHPPMRYGNPLPWQIIS